MRSASEILREHEDPELPSGIGSKSALLAIKAAQCEALEEAAKIAESWAPDPPGGRVAQTAVKNTALGIAQEIREHKLG